MQKCHRFPLGHFFEKTVECVGFCYPWNGSFPQNSAMLHQEQGEAMEAEKIYCHVCGLDRLDRLDPLDPACQ